MKVALYARVSTNKHKCRACKKVFAEDGNAESACPKCGSLDIERGQKPEAQLVPLREYATHRGATEVLEYIDRGQSGAKQSRPELDRLMGDARKHHFDAVLVARFDRFARSTRHLITALEEFRAIGIDFISMAEAIDTATPMGKMVFTMVSAVAELERSLIQERVQAGIDLARKNGKRLGRPRALVDVTKLRELYGSGWSVKALSKAFGIAQGTVVSLLGEGYRKKAITGDPKSPLLRAM